MPRSRSKWLSCFFGYGDWQCGHETLSHCRSLEDVRSWLSQPCTGTVETSASPFWRLLEALAPGTRIVTLHRPVEAVAASLRRAGMAFDDAVLLPVLEHAEAKLRQIARRLPNVLSVRFEDLADEACCAEVFEHCLPYRHDPAWWSVWAPLNVQVNVPHMMRYASAYAQQTARLRAQARHRILADMRKPVELNGVTFQQEAFAAFLADGRECMGDHFVSLGERPDYWQTCNIPLFQDLDAGGALHVWTARSNGRMFGYLLTVLAPSFDNAAETNGEQIAFFADAAWPGLGQKLQRSSIEDLRARGVKRVTMPVSVPRLDVLYRRMGAVPWPQTYGIELTEQH